MLGRIKEYYGLTKPGIIYGNIMTTASAFLLGSIGVTHRFDAILFAGVMGGTALIIAAGCVFNNYLDRGIDKKMKRTKNRALVNGRISIRNALMFASILATAGFGLLIWKVNWTTAIVGLVGFLDYVFAYGWAKRNTVHSTLVGTIAGATPIAAGYTAVSGRFDLEALLLFLIMCAWQMPHFYAIGMFRQKDYAKAGLPILPVVQGPAATKFQIMVYVAAFVVLSLTLGVLGYTGLAYLFVMLVIGGIWLWRGYEGYKTTDNEAWARRMFFFSLTVLLVLSVTLPVGALLP